MLTCCECAVGCAFQMSLGQDCSDSEERPGPPPDGDEQDESSDGDDIDCKDESDEVVEW